MRLLFSPALLWKCLALVCLLGSIICLQAQNPSSFSIQATYQNTPLLEILKEWESTYQIYFSYAPESVDAQFISAKIDANSPRQALKQLLQNTELEFSVRQGRFVSIYPSTKQQYCAILLDSISGTPISYAKLRLSDHSWQGLSREDGSLAFRAKNNQSAYLEVEHVGYQSIRITLTKLATQPCDKIYLSPRESNLQTVIIADYLTDGISYDQGALKVDPKRIDAMPGLVEPDPFRMMQALPGINTSEETAMGLNIRGGSADQTLIYFNEIPVYQSGHFFNMISSLNPYAVDEASIYRGAYDVSQTGGVSGLVKISQGDEIPAQNRYGANFNFTHIGLDGAIKLDKHKTVLYFSARRSLTDLLSSFTFNRLAERVFQETQIEERIDNENLLKETNTYNFQDASFKLIHRIDSGHSLSLSGFFGNNNLDFYGEDLDQEIGIADFLRTQNIGFSLNWQKQLSARHRQETLISYSDYLSDYMFNYEDLAAQSFLEIFIKKNALRDLRLKHQHQLQLNPQFNLHLGYEGSWKQAIYEIDANSIWDQYAEFQNPSTFIHSAFAHVEYALAQKWFFQGGLKLTYQAGRDKWFFSPRLDIHYRLKPWLTFKANAGRYFQFVAQFQEFALGDNLTGLDSQIWGVADGNNFPEMSSDQVALGWVFNRKGWLIDWEVYYKYAQNLNSFSRAFDGVSSLTDELVYSIGEMRTAGMDLLIKKRWQKQLTWLSYSLSRIEYDFPELAPRPFFAPQDQRHIFTINHTWPVKKWRFATSWTYRSGRPYTPNIGERLESGIDDGEIWYRINPVFGALNSERLPDYHRLDITAFYPFSFLRYPRFKGKVGASIQNLYNRENILSLSYFSEYYIESDPNPPTELFEVQKNFIFLLPNLSLRLEW
ncbi:MAG: TonB-dependent receptor [Bacteroidota bacterium]